MATAKEDSVTIIELWQVRPEIPDPATVAVDWWEDNDPSDRPPAPATPCPDCGSMPYRWHGRSGWQSLYLSASTRMQAAAMAQARCPNRRHATWRLFWQLTDEAVAELAEQRAALDALIAAENADEDDVVVRLERSFTVVHSDDEGQP
jgi:hypothetical protein